MRAFAVVLLVAACATTPPPPPERLAGCWIDRDAAVTTTMRWLPESPGILRGDLIAYHMSGQNQHAHYSLEPRGAGWVFCAHGEAAPACVQVAEGEEGSLEGGRAFIDAHEETLRISLLSEGDEDVIFEGRRDGCD